MQKYTRNPKVLLLDEGDGKRIPRMVSGRIIVRRQNTRGYKLENYFTTRILTTLDGDTNRDFVQAVQESSLRQLRVLIFFGDKLRKNGPFGADPIRPVRFLFCVDAHR